jgi:hypothetical protein
MEVIRLNAVEEKIIVIRDMPVLLDSDVAELYGVETMRINEAVKNNPEKFPKGYIFELSKEEKKEVIENFDNPKIKFSPSLPKAFTEKGLYMLATILKSKKAVETTFEIMETFTRIRELSRTIKEIAYEPEGEKRNLLVEKGGKMVSTILDNDLDIASIETSFEINLAAIKFKHTVTRRGKNINNESK